MKPQELMGTIDEQGNISLDQAVTLEHPQRVKVILLSSEELMHEDASNDRLEPAIEGLRQGWQDVMLGNVIPVARLWDNPDVD